MTQISGAAPLLNAARIERLRSMLRETALAESSRNPAAAEALDWVVKVLDLAPKPGVVELIVSSLRESSRVLARLAPTAAQDQACLASLLEAGWAAVAMGSRAVGRPQRLSRHRQVEIAREWWLRREREHAAQPPSAAEDWRAARREIPGVSRILVRRLRPPLWRAP